MIAHVVVKDTRCRLKELNSIIIFYYYYFFYLQDEDAIDNDGNDYEGEASRPQKHAKSPELARDFLLDAATVIFKEQVYVLCFQGLHSSKCIFLLCIIVL